MIYEQDLGIVHKIGDRAVDGGKRRYLDSYPWLIVRLIRGKTGDLGCG